MKRKQVNPYDAQFDLIHRSLIDVKGIEKLLDAPGGTRFLEFIAVRQYEMNGLSALYKHVIIPAINKNNVIQKDLWKKSRASKVTQLNEEHFREDKFTVIRLAYVQLFHRYESFINDLFPHCEQIGDDAGRTPGTLYSYIKTELGVDFKRASYHPTLKEVNYIANCVKHTNGLPRRSSIPTRFKDLDPAVPIRIPEAELHQDFGIIRDLMGQVVIHVTRANQLLLFKGLSVSMESGPLRGIAVPATGVLESMLKLEFNSYKANFSTPQQS